MGLTCVVLAVLVAAVRLARTVAGVSRRARVAPYRAAVLAIAADGDDDGSASAVLRDVRPREWRVLRDLVVAVLSKVRGDTAVPLIALLDARGEFRRARSALRSRLPVRRARGACLLGLARRRRDVGLLLPLLADRSPYVRLAAARSLGAIGDAGAAAALFEALGPVRGQPGIPAAAAAGALLGFGADAVPAVLDALTADDVTRRTAATMVAAESAISAAAPRLRQLLAGDPEVDIRVSAAFALGAVGGTDDVVPLAALTAAAQPARLRRAAAQALGELGHPDAVPVLSGLLADPDVRLAQHSGDALVRLGPPGVRALLEAAGAGRPPARVAASSLAIARLRNAQQLTAAQVPGQRITRPGREPSVLPGGEPVSQLVAERGDRE